MSGQRKKKKQVPGQTWNQQDELKLSNPDPVLDNNIGSKLYAALDTVRKYPSVTEAVKTTDEYLHYGKNRARELARRTDHTNKKIDLTKVVAPIPPPVKMTMEEVQQKRAEILRKLSGELEKQQGRQIKNIHGDMIHMMTPRETFYTLEGTAFSLMIQSRHIVEQSYLLASKQTLENLTGILRQCGDVLGSGRYDTVLWDPDVWEDATSLERVKKHTGAIRDESYFPSRPTYWMHACSRHFEENPFTFETDWWDSTWEMQGLYLYPSVRVKEDYEGAQAVGMEMQDSIGMISFWYKTANKVTEEDFLPRVVMELGHRFTERISPVFAAFVAAYEYLRDPYVEAVSEPILNHGERKEYKRKGLDIPELRTVLMRRKESLSREIGADPENGGGEEGEGRHISVHYSVESFVRRGKRIRGTDGKWVLDDNGEYVRRNPERVSPHTRGDLNNPKSDPQQIRRATR